jgi:hypothetical protein
MVQVSQKQSNPSGMESIINRFYNMIDSLSDQKRIGYSIGWALIAIVLVVAASLPLGDSFRWISAIAGAPAGIIIFGLILTLIHTTSLKDLSLFKIRETKTPRQRIPIALSVLGAIVVILILIASYIPIGVGGVTIIIACLSAFNIIRRTPQELSWASQGIPDPRELGIHDEDEEDYYIDEQDEDE